MMDTRQFLRFNGLSLIPLIKKKKKAKLKQLSISSTKKKGVFFGCKSNYEML